ncbi:MAG: hypothetical protein WKF89_10720, partial [Chitinophagaceae bacterium]
GVGSLSLQEQRPAHPLLGGTRGGFVVPTGAAARTSPPGGQGVGSLSLQEQRPAHTLLVGVGVGFRDLNVT